MSIQGLRVFANAWARALRGTCYVPMSAAAIDEYLCGLAGGIADGVLSAEFRPNAGADVGAALVTTHFASPEALGATIEIFDGRFLDDLGVQRPNVRERLATVLGALASGYTRALRDRTLDQQEAIRRAALMGRDQAEQSLRTSESRYRHLALHDSLTGLGNRRMVASRLESAFARTDRRVGVCLFNLDGFTVVNDSFGHHLADQLLIAVAGRLRRWAAPDNWQAARLGGDEFLLMVEDPSSVDEVADVARAVLADMGTAIEIDGQVLLPSASVGVVERSTSEGDPADLLRAADITMRRAKRAGAGSLAVFDDEHITRHLTRSQLSAALPAALDNDEFSIDYQPIVGLRDGEVIGFEALLRWEHPTLGTLGPDWFIPLAEQMGAIVKLGRRVIERACADALRWEVIGADRPFVSVNLAARQIQHPALLQEITAILRRSGLPARRLQLELTESAVMGTDEVAVAALRKLVAAGVRVAIDDFGTGYSNLTYLRTLPVTDLKLDGSFAHGLRCADDPDPVDRGIVAALVNLGHSLGLTVTAEGVETIAQADHLRLLGCDAGQGWHFGHPGAVGHPARLEALPNA